MTKLRVVMLATLMIVATLPSSTGDEARGRWSA